MRHGVVAIGSARLFAGKLCLGSRALEALKRERKTRGAHLKICAKRARKNRVVATARTHRIRQSTCVNLEYQARVVVKGVHDREVKGKASCILWRQARHQRAQLTSQVFRHARGAQQSIGAVEHLNAARQTRQSADSSLGSLRNLRSLHTGIEVDEVVCVYQAQNICRKRAVFTACEQLLKGADAAADNAHAVHTKSRNSLCYQRNNLNIARRATCTNKLKSKLRKLSRTTCTARALAHYRSLVAQTQRQVTCAHTTRN